MRNILIEKLHAYICENHPDILIEAKDQFNLNNYLAERYQAIEPYLLGLLKEEKPSYVIEELCFNEMIATLKPSKFMYLKNLLEEEFKGDYLMMKESGTLTYETINLIHYCKSTFESIGFTEENEDSSILKSALSIQIIAYLKES